jgi:hypothetical protein
MSFEKTSFRQSVEFNINNLCRKITATLLGLCLVFMISGCGIFGESDYKREQREEKQKVEKQAEQKKNQIQELEKKFDALSFPSEVFSQSDYTYQFQQYFNDKVNRNLIFQGTIEDVWQGNESIYVEILCPVGKLPQYWAEVGMVLEDGIFLRLKLRKEDAVRIINDVQRAGFNYEYLLIQEAQQILIVAQISEVRRERLYEHWAYGYGEDAEVELEMLKKVIAYGTLVAYEEYGMELEL